MAIVCSQRNDSSTVHRSAAINCFGKSRFLSFHTDDLLFQISIDAKLTFSNCGSATDSIRLTDLQIVPHPILAPGLGSFFLHVNFAQDIANPIKVSSSSSHSSDLLFVRLDRFSLDEEVLGHQHRCSLYRWRWLLRLS